MSSGIGRAGLADETHSHPRAKQARRYTGPEMSRKRNHPHKARLRRDRIRREKHAGHGPVEAPEPGLEHPFAAERAMWHIQTLLEGQKFESIEEANAWLAEITRDGRLAELAAASKQDDPKWRAQEIAYDALEADNLEEVLLLIHEAIKLDPDCTDAQRLLVSVAAPTAENKLCLMQELVEKTERNLGEDFFRKHAGHFWGVVSTRPYMRARQHWGELLAETGRLPEAAAVFERMLELNPDDNQGMRYRLLGLYLALREPEKARRLMTRYPDEEQFSPLFAWGRVLERWLVGDLEEARAALAHARLLNRYAERYISGSRWLPTLPPEYYQPGGDDEGQVVARELAPAWERNPGFLEWLRSGAPAGPCNI